MKVGDDIITYHVTIAFASCHVLSTRNSATVPGIVHARLHTLVASSQGPSRCIARLLAWRRNAYYGNIHRCMDVRWQAWSGAGLTLASPVSYVFSWNIVFGAERSRNEVTLGNMYCNDSRRHSNVDGGVCSTWNNHWQKKSKKRNVVFESHLPNDIIFGGSSRADPHEQPKICGGFAFFWPFNFMKNALVNVSVGGL